MPSLRSYRGIRSIRFGEFELDLRAAELRKNGQLVRLQEQPFRLLAMLVEHPGEVVLREEIRKRLWPNDTVVEVSHGINAAVQRLREALGDSAEEPAYVETVARRGYRFKARVENRSPLPAQADAEDLAGKNVAHYRVIEKLGSGGMGVVYRAEDLKLGRLVALKFLPEELAGEPVAVGRFEREARAASALSHPNICTVYAIEEHDGQPVIVMEFIEGETLEALLARGALKVERALGIAIQIAGALDAAHRKGVVHRDLKPANLILTTSGLKVLDFGLARMNRAFQGKSPDVSQITQQGAILGTPHYMSPEQVQGKDAEPPSDIFSFGVVVYEMLTGKRPFDGLTTADVMAAILTSEPAPLPAGTTPAELERILRRCLAKGAEERWQSASDLKAALEWVTIPKGIRDHGPGILNTLRSAGARLTRRHALAAAGAVGMVLLAIGWTHHQPGGHSSEVTRFALPIPAGNARLNLSPDGSRIAYVSSGRLFVRSFDAVVPSVLYEGDATGTPFWSPDGQSIALAGGGRLRVINANSGSATVLCEVNTTLAGDWGTDGPF